MEQDQQIAYIDETLPLVDGRFLLSPLAASRLLQLADIKASDHVLEIGCATGYLSTIMSYLCKSLVCVEQSETCAKFAAQKINEAAKDAKAPAAKPAKAAKKATTPKEPKAKAKK